jgi:hypothetical protein
LDSVLRGVFVAQQAATDSPDHGIVPPHQDLESGGVLLSDEPLEELAIAHPVDGRCAGPLGDGWQNV